MSFVTNPAQQMTLDDSIFHLTDRERKALNNSWAKPFSEEIFPKIDEEHRILLSISSSAPASSRNCLTCLTTSLLKVLCSMSGFNMRSIRQVLRNSRCQIRACPVFVNAATAITTIPAQTSYITASFPLPKKSQES